MTSTELSGAVTEVMRMDERGRVRVPKARREALLDEFERSGLSAAKFARLAGVRYTTFSNWRQGRSRARGEEPSGSPARDVRLLEAVIDGNLRGGDAGGGLLIELPCGARLRVESPLQLRLAAELLGMLSGKVARRC